MRMGFIFGEAFWGGFLILIGISMVLKVIFGFHIPVFRIALAIILIWFGISMLTGGGFRGMRRHGNTVTWEDSGTVKKEYNIIFGGGVIDLTAVKPEPGVKKVDINMVFGSGVVKLNPAIPVRIKADTVFGSTRFPDGSQISFGDYTYQTPAAETASSVLDIEADVVFGSLEIINNEVKL